MEVEKNKHLFIDNGLVAQLLRKLIVFSISR